MPNFGKTSTKRLDTCDGRLERLFSYVVRKYDCTILCGHRPKEEQDLAFFTKHSKLKWPRSKHNKQPSTAVDVAPYPIDWGETGTSEERRKAIARFYHFAGYVLGIAELMKLDIRWGGDWDQDKIFSDQKFDDLVHWELLDVK